MRLSFLVTLPVLAITACHVPGTSASGATLRGTRWELRQIGATEVRRSYPAGRRPYLRLLSDTTTEGHGGCNSFSGKARLSDEQVSFSQLRSTRMACDDLPAENAFMRALAATHHYRISGTTLFLYADDQRASLPLAQFEAVGSRQEAVVNKVALPE